MLVQGDEPQCLSSGQALNERHESGENLVKQLRSSDKSVALKVNSLPNEGGC